MTASVPTVTRGKWACVTNSRAEASYWPIIELTDDVTLHSNSSPSLSNSIFFLLYLENIVVTDKESSMRMSQKTLKSWLPSLFMGDLAFRKHLLPLLLCPLSTFGDRRCALSFLLLNKCTSEYFSIFSSSKCKC